MSIRQPRAPVVRNLEPRDAAPDHLAYVQARTAVIQCAARVARESSREDGRRILEIADTYLPADGDPREHLRSVAELEVGSYVLERDGVGWPEDEGSGVVSVERFPECWIITRCRPLVEQYLATEEGFWTDPAGLKEVPGNAQRFASAAEALEYWRDHRGTLVEGVGWTGPGCDK